MRCNVRFLKKRKVEADEEVAKPQLTSLIDVMTLLLVFLMQSFSAKSSEVKVSSNIELAESRIKNKAAQDLRVEIRKNQVFVMGKALKDVSEIRSQSEKLIVEVERVLRKIKSENPLEEKIQIQCDKSIEFSVIKKVLYSSATAGFKDYSLLVVEQKS